MKIMIKKIVFVFFIFSISTASLYCQVDSADFYRKELSNMKALTSFTPKDTSYIKLLNTLSNNYKYINTDSITILATEALQLSTTIDYEMGRFEALSNLAIYELITGNIQQSIDYNQQILKRLDLKKFPELGSNIYNVLGRAYFTLGNLPESYKHTRKSLLLAEMTVNKDLIRKLNSNLGTFFTYLEDYNEALKFYELALNSFSDAELSITKARILTNLGYLHMENKNYDKALELLDESFPILEKANITELLNEVYLAYGAVYYHDKRFDKAFYYFEKANSYYSSSNNYMNKALSFYGLGISHLAVDNLKASGEFLDLSLDLYKSINYKIGIEETCRALYQLFKKKKSTKNALYYLELSERYSDSIYKEKSARDISMLKAKIEFEEDKVNLNLKNDEEVAKQTKYIQWTSLGLACMITISILFFQANKTEKRLNQELVLQTTELSEKQQELNTINKNQDKLFSIVGHDLRGPIVSLKQLLGLALENKEGVQHFYRFGPKLKKDVEHIHFTLDNLLNWGKTQMQGEPVKPVKIDIKQNILRIEELFREVLDKKFITVHKSFVDNLVMVVDANHFNIIFRNLISNAIKFTPQNGQIWLNTYKENDTTFISVKDNGIGMSKEVLSRVFDSSEHYSTFGTDNERGTGLGLVLCKEMITKNKGALTVESEREKGSVFAVRFPNIVRG
jgi:signal transduction histidine kinase/Tfp pilus assembly protein PilF